jgi:ABC-type glutathione transport system ATPase component
LSSPLLSIRNVTKTFRTGDHEVVALADVSLDVARGQCIAIVGESGSGKSTLANIVLGIYPPSSGDVAFNGETLPARRDRSHRRLIQLVQQNPLSSLNPKRSIGASLRLALDVHDIGPAKERKAAVRALLEEVHLPADFADRQRVAIARALACQSELVVLDEPTSALDVLVQARVLKLLNELREKRGLTYIFITHDLSVVRNIADTVAVFQQGRIVEAGPTEKLFEHPDHPYTRKLIAAVPVITREEQALRASLSREELP